MQVEVLLSTYNGQKYIREQLDSLLKQNYHNFKILLRDDGSSDDTYQIVKSYSKIYKKIVCYQGNNIGIWKSFFDLMENADKNVEYYAFCDQDDYWLPEKLSQGISKLINMNQTIPLLYCSNTTPVNERLEPIKITINNKRFIPSFGNAVIQNIVTGCTCIFNRKLLEMVIYNKPHFMIMHDWWMYLVASYYGKVYYDENSFILYRQHKDNIIGAHTTRVAQWRYRIKTFHVNRNKIYKQNLEFQKVYQFDKNSCKLIEDVLLTQNNFKGRLKFLVNRKIYRQKISDDIIYRILVLLGKG